MNRLWRPMIIYVFIFLYILPNDVGGQTRRKKPQNASQSRRRSSPIRIIQLQTPTTSGSMSFEQALMHMIKIRALTTQTIPKSVIGQLGWAALDGLGTEIPLTMANRNGTGTIVSQTDHPMVLYFVMHDGIYKYQPLGHFLEQTSDQDMRIPLASAIFGSTSTPVGGCSIVLTGAIPERSGRNRFGIQRQRYLTAGRIVQNIRLQAACHDLVTLAGNEGDVITIHNICALSRRYEILDVIFLGYGAKAEEDSTSKLQPSAPPPTPPVQTPPRAVLITPSQNFRDEELFETARVLNEYGVQTVIASTQVGSITGSLGGMAQAHIVLEQINMDAFGAVIFIGGPGAHALFDHPLALQAAKLAVEKEKIVGAICLAPVILANAGVLKDISVTSYPTQADHLVQAGATYTGNPLERDGRIITAKGPAAATAFGQAIVEALRTP